MLCASMKHSFHFCHVNPLNGSEGTSANVPRLQTVEKASIKTRLISIRLTYWKTVLWRTKIITFRCYARVLVTIRGDRWRSNYNSHNNYTAVWLWRGSIVHAVAYLDKNNGPNGGQNKCLWDCDINVRLWKLVIGLGTRGHSLQLKKLVCATGMPRL